MNEIEKAILQAEIERIIDDVEEITGRKLFSYEVSTYLIEKGISSIGSAENIAAHVSEPEYKGRKPKILDRVISSTSYLPDGIALEIAKKKYKFNGEVWVIHKYDVDPFPSSPHAHNYDANIVMHLGNGEQYDKNRNLVSTLPRKRLIAFRKLITNVALPDLE